MATTVTSIHRANDRGGFNVSFQIDHTIGDNHAVIQIMHTSPGRTKNVELDIPLTEFPELIKSLTDILEETPLPEQWCSYCQGSGEVPISAEDFTQTVMCTMCGGKGIAR